MDYQLHWNVTEYGGVESIRIHPKLIWTPDLLMYNRWEVSFCSYEYSCKNVQSKYFLGKGSEEKKRIFYGLFTDMKMDPHFFFRK